ncbi:MAG TPA: hypothetical protein PKZ32_01415 [Candidatus Melainabacteria bacterium]|nr:hypothetical protein [Candidatus Melainabacteria bacterium]
MRRLQFHLIRFLFSATAILVACAPTGAKAAPQPKKMVKVWKVEQNSQLEGRITLYLSNVGAKMLCPVQHLVCVALPPTWEVKIANEKEKLGMQFGNEEWKYRAFRLVDKDRPTQGNKEKSRVPSLWRGKPAELFMRTVGNSDPLKEQVEMLYRESKSRSAEYSSEEFLLSRFVKFEPGVQNFLRGIYGLPQENGLLLRRTRNYPNKRVDTALDTTVFEETFVPAAEFTYPKGFKIAKSMSEVTQRQKKKAQTVILLEEMILEK